jgi:carboxyl-terminal processing protease
MRAALTLGVFLGCSAALGASEKNGVPDRRAPGLDPIEAQNFAGDLATYVIEPLVTKYIRPLTPADVATAALAGLYEASRVSAPGTLHSELEHAASEQELLRVIARHRDHLGDVEVLKGHRALLVGLQAALRLLDPFSGIASSDELTKNLGDGSEQGVGVELEDHSGNGPAVIRAVAPGGPAQRKGIRPRDILIAIDGKPTRGVSTSELQLRLGHGPGNAAAIRTGKIDLTLQRPGINRLRQLAVEPENFRPESVLGVHRKADNSWSYWIPGQDRVAHVRLANLATGSYQELHQVIESLQQEGLRGLILDLRWCPGGYLKESEYAAGLFLAHGTIATVVERDPRHNERFVAENLGTIVKAPMAVLINGDSSGGAELVAAALQDNKRAIVIGQRTRGKASVQRVLPLPVPGAGLKLTSGTFNRPSGKNLHRFPEHKPTDDWGVCPDPGQECPVSRELSQLLRDWWLAQTLRPGASNEALPLDDPGADPQREAALQALKQVLR